MFQLLPLFKKDFNERRVLMERKPPMYYLVYTGFIVSFVLITYFGIGPVLLADGAMGERVLTGFVVLLLYFVWGYLYARWRRINR